MKVFPFETGYLSTMSENELLDLAHELECNGAFWDNEEAVQRIVESYITHYWRRSHGAVHVSRPGYSTLVPVAMPMQASRDIIVSVPDALDERTARLFIEMQIREQMDPQYDPTQNEV
jgi:hypothetical protein